MDAHDLVALPTRMFDLLMRRWRQLLVGVGVVATINVVLFEVLLHLPDSAGGSSAELPTFMSIAKAITIAYLVVVAYASLPMAVATSALTEGEDDVPYGHLLRAVPAALRQWARLAMLLSPFLLLALWVVHSLLSMVTKAIETMSSGAAGAEPGIPLALRLVKLLGTFPMGWVLAVTVIGAWCMYAAVDALGIQRRWVPADPRPLVARHPLAVGVLAVLSAIVLGPVLKKALSGTIKGIVPSVDGASGEGTGIVVVVLLAIVVSAFISLLALAWVSLYDDEERESPPTAETDEVLPGVQAAPAPDAGAVASDLVPVAPVEPAMQPQVVDLPQIVQPGATLGWWVHAPAGAAIGIGTWVGSGVAPRVAVADQAGAWSGTHAAPDGTQVFVSPADAWYYVAVASQDAAQQQLHVRLILPHGAQMQQQQAAG